MLNCSIFDPRQVLTLLTRINTSRVFIAQNYCWLEVHKIQPVGCPISLMGVFSCQKEPPFCWIEIPAQSVNMSCLLSLFYVGVEFLEYYGFPITGEAAHNNNFSPSNNKKSRSYGSVYQEKRYSPPVFTEAAELDNSKWNREQQQPPTPPPPPPPLSPYEKPKSESLLPAKDSR